MSRYTTSIIILAISALALAGCVTSSKLTNSENIIGKSWNSKTTNASVKKPKYAPHDWIPGDASSRGVWFRTKKRKNDEICGYFFSAYNSQAERTYLRSGNVIIEVDIHSWLSEILSVKASPESSLVAIKGINGVKPQRTIFLEVTDDFDKMEFEYVVVYDSGEIHLKECEFSGERFQAAKKQQAMIEAKRDAALKRLAENPEIAPTLAPSQRETNAPVIDIGSLPSVVDELNFVIRGQVRDDTGVARLIIRGEAVKVSADGRFVHRLKLGYGTNELVIAAEDINGNIAKKTLSVTRQDFLPENALANVDIPPKTRMNNPDALAVVIGVERYQYLPDATYAYNDAEVFREYLAETMGMKRQRIKLATNSKATQAELSKLLGPNGWLARNIAKGKSDVVVYFSGHGIASPDAKSSGLLPHDVDPNYSVGLQTTQLYRDLAAMGAKSVTVFLDACFTGQTRNSEMLIANARPIVIQPLAAAVPENITVISAASGAQISGALEEKEHGLFTYYLLKGLGGDADTNNDKSININELNSFISAKVKEQAALNGREQTPEIQGSSDSVLVSFQ